MAILITFLLGIGNFAMHKAVLESRHPVVELMPRIFVARGGVASLAVDYAILLAVLLLVANGQHAWSWAYVIYSVSNAIAAWLILGSRS